MDGASKIVADRGGGIYLGGFVNHFVDDDHVACFEQMSGQDQDIALRFVSFADLKGGQVFLKEEAERMYQRGGALFVKLEPWSAGGANDDSFSLENLKAGKFDKIIIAFAKACHKAGRPVFVTFGHEPQITDQYPWGKDPALYKEAFRYVHDLVNRHTDKVTWVWNPNVVQPGGDLFKYDPGRDYYSWIALDGYHPRSGGTFKEIFENSLGQITAKYPDLDIMIGEFASNAPDRAAVFNETFDYLASTAHRIKAFLYFNVNESGNNWTIIDPKNKAAYAAALKKHDALFRGSLQLAGGGTLGRGKTAPPPANCGVVEGSWFTPFWERTVHELSRDIRAKEKCFQGIVNLETSGISIGANCGKTEANKWHLLLSGDYVNMAMLKEDNEAVRDTYIQRALEQLSTGLGTIYRNDQKPTWPPIRMIKNYFELKMGQAEVFRDYGQVPASIALGREILSPSQLYNSDLRHAHDVDDESVGGIAARTKGIMADGMLIMGKEASVDPAMLPATVKGRDALWVDLVNSGNLNAKGVVQAKFTGDFAVFAASLPGTYTENEKKNVFAVINEAYKNSLSEALYLYEEVIAWVDRETKTDSTWIGDAYNWAKLFWKSGKGELDVNPRLKIMYIGALAELGKAEIMVRRGKLEKAFAAYNQLLNWERVGLEKEGYMDLAMKSLIGAMVGCARLGNYRAATEKFERGLPWDKINGYEDLKKALSLDGIDLTSRPAAEKWELLKNRLRLVRLGRNYRNKLQNVEMLTP